MRLGIFIVGLFLSMGVLAQDYTFDVTVKGAGDSSIYLIRYQGDKLYYADTAQADKAGKVSFDSKFIKKPGMYAVMPGKGSGYFEIILNNEDIVIETEMGAARYVPSMNVKKSSENKIFYDYIDFIQSRSGKLEQLQAKKEIAKTAEEKKKIQNKINELNKEVVAKQKKIVKDHDGSVVALLLSTNLDVEVPDPPKDENGVIIDSMFQRNYYVSHYWKNIDLKNDALVRMPVFHKRMERYFEKIIPQQPDSLIQAANRLVSQMEEGSELFKYTVVWITSHYQKSKIMCMDKVFVHMVLKYYKTGKAYWMTEDKNKEIVDRAEEMAPVTCGEMAHNISLPDTSKEKWIKLHSLDFENTVLIFWDPDCGHCKKEIPKLIKAYKKWQEDGLDVEVYSVSSKNSDEWVDFVIENNLIWINVAVPEQVFEDQGYVNKIVATGITDLPSLNYHSTFDVYKTPTVYLLDKDKIIVGKSLDAEGLDKIVRRLQGHDE